jgi:hypothetical protein
MPPKYILNKVTTYDLVTYYDKLINKDNPDLHVVRSEFQDEASALAEGKRLAVKGVHMFEIFARNTYEEGGRKVVNCVNTVRWVNFRPANNAFLR